MNNSKREKGITLIALVVTIIVLIILAGVTLNMLLGENGIINRTKTARDENEKATATETMNLKITNVQISKYAEEQRMPTLKELADNFCEDDDFQYVQETSEVASLNKITNNNPTSIYTKLKAYPYEFEINSSLQLASIDGVKVASKDTNEYVSQSQYNSLLARVVALENNLNSQSSSSSTNINYSTDSQIIGTWIDGKTLYQKTIDFGSLPNSSTKQVEHNIDNLSMIVNLYCLRYNPDGSEFDVVPSAEPEGNSWASNLFADSKYVKVKTCENYSAQKAYITIQYTVKATPTE